MSGQFDSLQLETFFLFERKNGTENILEKLVSLKSCQCRCRCHVKQKTLLFSTRENMRPLSVFVVSSLAIVLLLFVLLYFVHLLIDCRFTFSPFWPENGIEGLVGKASSNGPLMRRMGEGILHRGKSNATRKGKTCISGNYPPLSASKGDPFKIIVMFCHYVSRQNDRALDNMWFFLRFGVKLNDTRVDYAFVFTSDDPVLEEQQRQVLLPNQVREASNVVQYFVSNHGSDLCGFAQAFERHKILTKYKYFFFFNSSVRGPFLPNYWTDPWLVSHHSITFFLLGVGGICS